MKVKTAKMNLKKMTIVNLNNITINALRGGSSIPTDSVNGETDFLGESDQATFQNYCDSHGR